MTAYLHTFTHIHMSYEGETKVMASQICGNGGLGFSIDLGYYDIVLGLDKMVCLMKDQTL